MREISAELIRDTIERMCIKANCILPEDMKASINKSFEEETFPQAKSILGKIIDNYTIAEEENMPVCQDTGAACVFIKIGQDVHVNGSLEEAVHEGVRRGYTKGFLRKSIVGDPLERKNTGDNTPAMIYYEITTGDKIDITLAPKGFGSENMSRIKMLKPSEGVEGVIDFVVETVKLAGPNPCPPVVVGVGIGGTFDKCALLAKKALLRSAESENPHPYYAELEKTLLSEINKLGIGPQGFGGKTTALAVNVEQFATHIAGLPVAVNINCHVTRHVREVL